VSRNVFSGFPWRANRKHLKIEHCSRVIEVIPHRAVGKVVIENQQVADAKGYLNDVAFGNVIRWKLMFEFALY